MLLRRSVTLFLVVAATTLAGCNSSPSSSVVPDTAPPLAPAKAEVQTSGNTIVLNWQPNAEADLAGYNVYRAAVPLQKINTTLVTSATFEITTEGSGPLRFRVTAVDQSGNESAPSPMVLVKLNDIPTGRPHTTKDGITLAG